MQSGELDNRKSELMDVADASTVSARNWNDPV